LLGSDVLSPSLEPDVVGTVALSNSLHWHSRSKIEWSVDVESKLFVEALGSNSLSLVNIDNLPSLVGIIIVVSISSVDHDFLAFFIFGTINFDNLIVVWINEEFSLKLEHLEPSGVGAPDLHVSSFTSVLDVP